MSITISLAMPKCSFGQKFTVREGFWPPSNTRCHWPTPTPVPSGNSICIAITLHYIVWPTNQQTTNQPTNDLATSVLCIAVTR